MELGKPVQNFLKKLSCDQRRKWAKFFLICCRLAPIGSNSMTGTMNCDRFM